MQLDQPLITFYGPRSQRIELSTKTLTNWQSKLANLYQDDIGIAPGDRINVRVDNHWIAPALISAAGWVGASVTIGSDTNGDLVICDLDAVATVPPDAHVLVCSRSLLAQPHNEALPIGIDDLFAEARVQADQFTGGERRFPEVFVNTGSAAADLDGAVRQLGIDLAVAERVLVLDSDTASPIARLAATTYLPVAIGIPIVWVRGQGTSEIEQIRDQERINAIVNL